MTFEADSAVRAKMDVLRDAMRRDLMRHSWSGQYVPLPPLPWYRRRINRFRVRLRNGRERVALFICPWLDRY